MVRVEPQEDLKRPPVVALQQMTASSVTTPRWITYGTRYAIGMSLYGFTRGYRATHHWDTTSCRFVPHTYLIADRVGHGIMTAFFYAMPYTLPWSFGNLVNRVEIHLRGWKPEDFPETYREFGFSYCPTIL